MKQPSQADQHFLEQALPQLQEYLLSDELYWALGGDLPRLTPGNLLLALARLEAVNPAPALAYRRQLETLQVQWASAWMKKVARETANRLRLWSQALEERNHAEGQSRAVYAADVRGRVILQLLLKENPNAPEGAALAELDQLLRARLVSGDFVWEDVYRPAFAPDEFWFLYGSL